MTTGRRHASCVILYVWRKEQTSSSHRPHNTMYIQHGRHQLVCIVNANSCMHSTEQIACKATPFFIFASTVILIRPVLHQYRATCGKTNMSQRDIARKLSIAKIHIKQDRQCTHNVTLKCIRATTVAVGKQYVLHILCVCL